MISLTIFDLHSHTNASDGQLSPELLIERAVERKVNYLAITDHDCVDAIAFARQKIVDDALSLKLINGVEISTNWLIHDIHVVGLNIDISHPTMTALLAAQATVRYDRALRISEKLEKIDVHNSLKEIEASLAATQNSPFPIMLTRNHFASYLVSTGKAKNHQKAFDKILGKGSVGYVRADWCDMQVAIDAIHAAGGKAVLAHPFAYPLKGKWGRRLIEAFAEMGGDALEVTNSQLTPDKRTHFAKLSQEFNLYVSVGSDFHRPTPWYDLGKNLWLPANVKPIWETFL